MRLALPFLIFILLSTSAFSGQDVLRTSGNPDYPPSSWAQDGAMLGVGAELVKAIYKDRPISVESVDAGPWARVQNAAKLGKVDIITTLYRTKEREQYLLYTSLPYMMDENVIFVRKGSAFLFTGWKDLVGKKGGLVIGDSYGQALDKIIRERLDAERTPNIAGVFGKLIAGRIQYFPYGRYAGMFQAIRLHMDDQIEMLPEPLSAEGLYIAVSKASRFASDLPFIEERLQQLLKDGTVDTLISEGIRVYLQRLRTEVEHSQ